MFWNKKNFFCYFCALLVDKNNKVDFTPSILTLYRNIFKKEIEIAPYTPEVCCSSCYRRLRATRNLMKTHAT